ncbi:hypothetical protein GPECTOR_1g293 [Gonium pectorale]|uniref:Fungal lipase-type domain-containing protein n=1 Tax=Gonium pectorale TaxID=33097 RepID=A0A150H2X0_GONPE|nr:hypothetical protein GPECTOR_1g293 [Gonium pectorale]|eukprot:KXZ56332.1 hypothetical protein GPECTOR_1g293 [Gonium pectorale]
MAGVARGLGSTGLGQATFGLQALARRHEEERLQDHPPGKVMPEGAATQAEAERLLDGLELAHGAYRRSAAALAATTCLRAQHVHVWRPQGGRLQPAYYLAVDHPGRRVVWGVRGTRVFADLLTDLTMAAHPLGAGAAHWGMTHAAHWLLQQEAHRVSGLIRSLRPGAPYRLELVGHSMGGAVAALMAVMLRERLVEAARVASVNPDLISCLAFAPPACMSPELARLCRPYVTSVCLNNDIVPRFNVASLAVLQEELQSVSSTLEAWTPASLAPSAELASRGADQALAPRSGLDSPSLPTSPQPVAAAAAAVQQLSAAVLQSAAFRSALESLDMWKAKALAVAGDPAEAAIRRQADVIRAWLQELAAGREQRDGDGTVAVARSGGQARAQPEGPAPPSDSLRVAAEAAAERLRQSVEAALSSFTAAATASRDRLSGSIPAVPGLPAALAELPSLPSLPSLPRPHELPLIEPAAAAAAAAAMSAAAAAGTAGTAASLHAGTLSVPAEKARDPLTGQELQV